MVDPTTIFAFSAVMGLSIYLSLPLVMSRNVKSTRTLQLNAIALGILIFLIGDVFSNASTILYNGTLYGYGSDPAMDLAFTVPLVGIFLVLLYLNERSKNQLSPTKLSLLIALGIGLQNLTEGLVFGSLGSIIGLTGATLVVLLGFTLQNAVEGFPIASPLVGRENKSLALIIPLFLVGGLPTIVGAVAGYYYNSNAFDAMFDGFAIGGILYVVLQLFRTLFRHDSPPKTIYLGVFVGFILGFLVNLI